MPPRPSHPLRGGRDITQLPYRPAEPDLPVESFTLASLIERVGPRIDRPERLGFNLVVLCTGGRGTHEVDFVEVALEPRHLLHVRPGQVHRWRRPGAFQADLLLFPDVIPARGHVGASVSVRPLDAGSWATAIEIAHQLRQERALHDDPDRWRRAATLLRDLLIVRLGLDLAADGARSRLPEPYLAFCEEMGRPPLHRSVAAYASLLGYSPRTLARACALATGQTAKQLLDEQILLEARRWLAHTDRPVSDVARQLGFTEPTNFTKFFVHRTGGTPRSWRESTRGTGGY